MKVYELIKKLNEMPKDVEVNVDTDNGIVELTGDVTFWKLANKVTIHT